METPSTPQQTPDGGGRSPRAGGDPAVCDPSYHVSGPWCSRCGQWFVDGEWRNTPPETTQLDPADVHSDDVMLSAQVQERPELLVVTGSSDHFSPLLHQMYPELRLNEFSRLMEQAALRCYERASSLEATPTGRITFTIVAEQIATPKER